MLHIDKTEFKMAIRASTKELKLREDMIEKDYYVTLFLEKIVERIPNIVFKGGTSLSKCYNVIKRFSEDIDLNLIGNSRPTEGERRALKKNIVEIINDLGFSLENEDEIRSKREFNRYIIKYPTLFPMNNVKQNLIVETAVFLRSYPHTVKTANSYIYDYFLKNGKDDLIDKFELHKFEVRTQSIERTLIDKCFALADYYLSGKIKAHSRHIYDIYKLMQHITLDDDFKALAETVRIDRQSNKNCLSSVDDIDLNEVLTDILTKEIYKKDYEETTQAILFKEENVSYDDAAKGLQEIIKSNIFKRKDESMPLDHLNDSGSKNPNESWEGDEEDDIDL